jgi:hypothetical protein
MRLRPLVGALALAASLVAIESGPAAACGWGGGYYGYGYAPTGYGYYGCTCAPPTYGYYGYAPRAYWYYGYAPAYYGW